jgi:hypothetical protein
MHYVFNPDHYIGIVIANTTLLYNNNNFIAKQETLQGCANYNK